MPNWCHNTLTIQAERATLCSIIEFVRSDKSVFDFNKIIPMPDDIKRTYTLPGSELSTNNWYGWSLAYWGTKWNAVNALLDNNTFTFDTAWSPCYPVIGVLAQQFPQARIRLQYFVPIGSFCGVEEYHSGKNIYSMRSETGFAYFDSDNTVNTDYLIDDDTIVESPSDPNGVYTTFIPHETDDEGRVLGEYHRCTYEAGVPVFALKGTASYIGDIPVWWYE